MLICKAFWWWYCSALKRINLPAFVLFLCLSYHVYVCVLKEAMADEAHRSPAAQISVTRNGESDRSHEDVFQRVRYSTHNAVAPAHTKTLNLIWTRILFTSNVSQRFLSWTDANELTILSLVWMLPVYYILTKNNEIHSVLIARSSHDCNYVFNY